MDNIDIADLLRRALRTRGCSDQQVGTFDSHSNIELQLQDLRSLNSEQVQDQLWFWTPLNPHTRLSVESNAMPLLTLLMNGAQYAQSGQMQLVDNEHRLELRCLISQSALQDEHVFGLALEEFLGAIEAVVGILGR